MSVCTKTSEVAEERVAALENELASLKVTVGSQAARPNSFILGFPGFILFRIYSV